MEAAKSVIKSFVLDLRKTLEKEIEVGLRRYGIAAGKWREISELRHLDDRGIAARFRMEEAIRHEMRRGNGHETEKSRAEAVHWFVREVAFTHLNRLVALKAMEVRGLIPEIIQTRPDYGNRSRAHQEFREAHPELANASDDALEAAIKEICRQVYPEFRILFDVGDQRTGKEVPANSLLWPSYPVLKDCIAKINQLDADAGRSGPPSFRSAAPEESVWAEDEIIGWIYQFYNAEEKIAIRKKGKPKRPAEVAVINQFFTPRWIVKYLVDNTLGRLWLEMHPDSSRVRAKCDYLVPEPAPASEDTENEEEHFIPDPDSPINHPNNPPRRKAKRPQDIRLIDPACGTMHFGHYAFEVFQEIYADAREQGWVLGSDALPDEEVPTAILKYNLYGVDIDLRAVQLAALSLFIKAKTANPDAQIERVNLVVADAYLPEGSVRDEFLKQYAGEPVIQKAFREVFDSLNNVAEVGSLLRVEERFRQILEAANHPAVNSQQKKTPQQIDFDDVSPTWSPTFTIGQMLNHLREFSHQALAEHDINAQIFASETEKSVALLDIFLHDYDAVVMNPPYGQALSWEGIIDASDANRNLYCAFILRARFLAPHGYIGALTDRTFLLLYSFRKFRNSSLKNAPLILGLDLGWDVLDDANVATIAAIYSMNPKNQDAIFFKCLDSHQKRTLFEKELQSLRSMKKGESTYIVSLRDFRAIPTHPFCYWVPDRIRILFRVNKKFEPNFGIVRKGISPGITPRFVRYHWEVHSKEIGFHKWAKYANGGEYSPYYRDNVQVILWKDNGKEIKLLKPKSVIRSGQLYGEYGLTFASRHHYLNVQRLEKSHIFSNEGFFIQCNNEKNYNILLSVLNSSLYLFMINLMAGLHKQVSHVKNLPIQNSLLSLEDTRLAKSETIYNLKSLWDTGNETSTKFA